MKAQELLWRLVVRVANMGDACLVKSYELAFGEESYPATDCTVYRTSWEVVS